MQMMKFKRDYLKHLKECTPIVQIDLKLILNLRSLSDRNVHLGQIWSSTLKTRNNPL
jgi:hypothetical protein